MSNIVIVGAFEILGSRLAGRLLLRAEQPRICWIWNGMQKVRPDQLVELVREQISTPEGGSALSRLSVAFSEEDASAITASDSIQEVWLLNGARSTSAQVTATLDWITRNGVRMLTCVDSAYSQAGAKGDLTPFHEEIIRFCSTHEVAYRIVITPLLVDSGHISFGATGSGDLIDILAPLQDVIEEVRDHWAEYFDHQPLRWAFPASGYIKLISATSTVDCILRIVDAPSNEGNTHQIAGTTIPLKTLCSHIGEVYGVTILPEGNTSTLNAIDRLFAARLGEFDLSQCVVCLGAGDEMPFDKDGLIATIRAVRDERVAWKTSMRHRFDCVRSGIERRTVSTGKGELEYFATTSEGEPVILLNALGQDLYYWSGLIDHLMARRRVITWTPRGLAPDSKEFKLRDQVRDLDAILNAEKVDACHLVAWCTGPQAAIEYYALRPTGVRSMIFLNCAFAVPGRPDLQTPYERALDQLCRAVIRLPAMAPSVMQSVKASTRGKDPAKLETRDNEKLASYVLSLANDSLSEYILAPFATVETTVRYARQIVDLASYNAFEQAPRIQAPVLLVAGEYDTVVSTLKARVVAKAFPNSTYREVAGGTHYLLYDNPLLVANIIEDFLEKASQGVGATNLASRHQAQVSNSSALPLA